MDEEKESWRNEGDATMGTRNAAMTTKGEKRPGGERRWKYAEMAGETTTIWEKAVQRRGETTRRRGEMRKRTKDEMKSKGRRRCETTKMRRRKRKGEMTRRSGGGETT